MACFHPLQAYQTSDGSIIFSERKGDVVRSLSLPCGQCRGCRLERSRQWAVRCMHEASLHEENCFITLTYDNDHCPTDRSLNYGDYQRFMKRFRKRFKDSTIRFYMAGEYGEKFERPHFHACIFGFNFPDRTLWKRTPSGALIYRSKLLEDLWPFGYSSIGDVTFESAAYVARYVMKKRTGKGVGDHYETTDFETGEIKDRVPEFNRMSLKPGIGYEWYRKFSSDIYPHDYVVINGREARPPKFYDKKFADDFPEEFEALQFQRFVDAVDRFDDNTDERLHVKEQVLEAKFSRLKRNIE
ncbi:MAG: replication initiator protein [Arizlama microvirus]|nr:MAG: replication initiator protein [Arizlama microvirus]